MQEGKEDRVLSCPWCQVPLLDISFRPKEKTLVKLTCVCYNCKEKTFPLAFNGEVKFIPAVDDVKMVSEAEDTNVLVTLSRK